MKFKHPPKLPEANMQAELYRQLTNRGVNCFLEYPITKVGNGKLRADCIILDRYEENIIAVIEVKSFKNPNSRPWKMNKQRIRYKLFYEDEGVPFFYVYNLDTIKKVIEWIRKTHPDYWLVDTIQGKTFIKNKEYSDWDESLYWMLEVLSKSVVDKKMRGFIASMDAKAKHNIPITKKQANLIHHLHDKN